MTAHPEITLMILAAAIYLFDSLILLGRNEAMIGKNLAGRWEVTFGSNTWKIRGREPFLPNPFLPHKAQYRLTWKLEGMHKEDPSRARFRDALPLSGLAPLILLAGLCMFVWLPLCFFTQAGMVFTLPLIACLYASVIAALFIVFRRRTALELTNTQFYSLAFECLICIPLAVNLIRKLARMSTHSSRNADLNLTVPTLGLSPEAWDAYRSSCLVRIKDEIDSEQEGSARMLMLQSNLKNFSQEDSK